MKRSPIVVAEYHTTPIAGPKHHIVNPDSLVQKQHIHDISVTVLGREMKRAPPVPCTVVGVDALSTNSGRDLRRPPALRVFEERRIDCVFGLWVPVSPQLTGAGTDVAGADAATAVAVTARSILLARGADQATAASIVGVGRYLQVARDVVG